MFTLFLTAEQKIENPSEDQLIANEQENSETNSENKNYKNNNTNNYGESKLDFNPYLFEKREISIESTDDYLTKFKKVCEMIYFNSLHYLSFSHVFFSRYLAYPYNYIIYTVFGYILACLFGVSSGDGIFYS